jgi:hypothetical protein
VWINTIFNLKLKSDYIFHDNQSLGNKFRNDLWIRLTSILIVCNAAVTGQSKRSPLRQQWVGFTPSMLTEQVRPKPATEDAGEIFHP